MLKSFRTISAVIVVLLTGSSAPAVASEIICGGSSGIRVTAIDPGLVGGVCATGTGNLKNSDIAALGLTTIDKDVVTDFTGSGVAGGDSSEGSLAWTQLAGGRSGSWSVQSAAWADYSQVYLGFHFGGSNSVNGNPDYFVVELMRTDTHGTWDLNPDILSGPNNTNGSLSNVYLLGAGGCTSNCGGNEVPEPSSLALVGLGLLGMGIGLARRKTQKSTAS